MFDKNRKLYAEVERHLLYELDNTEPHHESYATMVQNLAKLREAKKPSIPPATWLSVAANLFGIILIIKAEEVNVLSAKALSFVKKS